MVPVQALRVHAEETVIMPASSQKPVKRRPVVASMDNPAALYSKEAEQAVLGCMLGQPGEVLDIAMEKLTSADFFILANQEIFDAIVGMWNNNVAIDVMTIHQWLTDRKLAESVGSPGILADLLVGYATWLNVGSYIQIVQDKSLLRKLQTACLTILQDIIDMPDSVPSVLDRAEAGIMAATTISNESDDYEATVQTTAKIIHRITSYTPNRDVTGLPTGFSRLDDLTQGWHPGEMIVIGGRPGQGKTTLGMHFAKTVCKYQWNEEVQTFVEPGLPVGVIEIEMPAEQLMMRMLADEARIPLQLIRKGLTVEEDKTAARTAKARMDAWPLYIKTPSSITISQLRSKARRMKADWDIHLLVIDYLQMVMSMSKQAKDNRQNEVAEVSRGIKTIARELNIPVIILAQLNRRSDEKGGEPALHNLKESGAIEQDADVVILIHPEKPDDDESRKSPVVNYIANLAKQRNGPTDRIKLLLNTRYNRFEEPVQK